MTPFLRDERPWHAAWDERIGVPLESLALVRQVTDIAAHMLFLSASQTRLASQSLRRYVERSLGLDLRPARRGGPVAPRPAGPAHTRGYARVWSHRAPTGWVCLCADRACRPCRRAGSCIKPATRVARLAKPGEAFAHSQSPTSIIVLARALPTSYSNQRNW